VINNPNYKSISHINQTRGKTTQYKKRDSLLAQGCRGSVTQEKVVYLATPLDQFHDPHYSKIRDLIAPFFPASEWAIFEPARSNWSTADWLKTWPRLLRWIDALIIWPRIDGSVGFGVYQEARDTLLLGKPVYVLDTDDRLKSFKSFSIYKKHSASSYAQVRAGKLLRQDHMPEGGA
jgi:hypothetical protein